MRAISVTMIRPSDELQHPCRPASDTADKPAETAVVADRPRRLPCMIGHREAGGSVSKDIGCRRSTHPSLLPSFFIIGVPRPPARAGRALRAYSAAPTMTRHRRPTRASDLLEHRLQRKRVPDVGLLQPAATRHGDPVVQVVAVRPRRGHRD